MTTGSECSSSQKIKSFIFDKKGRVNFRRLPQFKNKFPEEYTSILEYTQDFIFHEKFDTFKYRFLAWWFGYTKEDLICRRYECSNPVPWHNFSPQKLCSNACRKLDGKTIGENLKKSNMEKYGVTSTAKLEETKEKFRKTCQERYNVDAPMQNEELKTRFKNSILKKYNVFWPMQSEEIQEKSKKTCYERYSADWPLQSKKIQKKIEETCIRKYGTRKPFLNKDIQNKSIKTINPFIKFDKRKQLTKEFIKKHFLTDENKLNVKKFKDFVGWLSVTSVYNTCRVFSINWTRGLGGFDPTKPATLYYIYDPQEDMYKIGITNYPSAEERFGKGFCSKRAIAILEQWDYEIGEHAYLAEQEVLKAFKDYRCTNPSWPEELGGKTEFFKTDILKLR